MIECEWILKVEYREEQTEELAQSDDKSDNQGGALCGENKDPTDTHIPRQQLVKGSKI